jgi:heme-degrading monooxygenase HmoA
VVDANVNAERESELIDGYRHMIDSEQLDGLIRSELLRGQDGRWRIQSTWRDLEALQAVRKLGKPPAALELLESVGAEHSHTWFVIEAGSDST